MSTTPYARILFIHSHRQEALAAALILSRIGPQVQLSAKAWEGCHLASHGLFDLIVVDDSLEEIPINELFFKLSFENRKSTLILSDNKEFISNPGVNFPGALDVLKKTSRPMELVATICEILINKFEKEHQEAPQLIIN
ncbi:MAG: hypothetical protein G3M70_12480 [Candidatus Nitronauta litoralis]|uniref:Response regulatory domain-containing protein n=1 Tax=Candidatus Nitronauta litoralis TaxID=2705533 RepID=A0A7T0G0L7_9BACT|nr:MAG: hypothetical protein G3M70_12480 [Candidatus Nitronauta litoralis]